MNHPTQEEWIAFVYGELPPGSSAPLETHLASCSECRLRVDGWRESMARLDEWKLPARRRPRSLVPAIQWGLAALFLVGLGAGITRLTNPRSPDLAQVRAQLLPGLREDLRREFNADLQAALRATRVQFNQELERSSFDTLAASSAESRRLLTELAQAWATDQQKTLALLDREERRRKADVAWIRTDLEKVAVATDATFKDIGQELGQWASYSQPVSVPGGGQQTPTQDP